MQPSQQRPLQANELELLLGRDQANSIRGTNDGAHTALGGGFGPIVGLASNSDMGHEGGRIQGQGASQTNHLPSQIHLNKRASLSDRYSMNHYDGLSFDALFGSMYDSEKDEDYSVKEDLIQNTKTYQNDFKPFKHNVSKAEIAYLKSQQKFDSLLFATGFEQQANEGLDAYL